MQINFKIDEKWIMRGIIGVLVVAFLILGHVHMGLSSRVVEAERKLELIDKNFAPAVLRVINEAIKQQQELSGSSVPTM